MIDVLPVTIVAGYLGAGKTTLVNHVLREARGRRIAVLVNDFGTLPVDADLVVSRAANVIHLAGGCICCSFGDDLVGALMDVAGRACSFDHVLVETSGVSLPQGVARAVSLLPKLSLRSTVVVADASTLRERITDRFVGDTVTLQLAQADRIVLNKVDRVSPDALAAIRNRIARTTSRATIVESTFAAVAAGLVLDAPSTRSDATENVVVHDAAELHEAVSFVPGGPVDISRLALAIAHPHCGVVRAKGVLRGLDGTLLVLQIVDGVVEVGGYEGEHPPHEGLVCIGVRGQWNRARVDEALNDARVRITLRS